MYFDKFVEILPTLLYGLAGIFIVIAIIAFAIRLMHWVFPERKGSQPEDQS